MSEHPPELEHRFVFREPYEKKYCVRCGRVLMAVVPAPAVTYLVHTDRTVCVIDNQEGGSGGLTRLS